MQNKQLESLRLSVRRIAEATGDDEIIKSIPAKVTDDKGWNILCSKLLTYLFHI
jgi:hypothetical protein